MLKQGDFGIIKELHGRVEVVKRMEDLGFVPDTTVTVITKLSGNLIVELKGTRIALNQGMANRIIVEE